MSKDKNGLQDWSEAFDRSRDRREEEIKTLSEKLGEPDYVEKTEFESYGYWRVEKGVISYRLRPTGLAIPETRIEYLDTWFEKMNEVRQKPVRK